MPYPTSFFFFVLVMASRNVSTVVWSYTLANIFTSLCPSSRATIYGSIPCAIYGVALVWRSSWGDNEGSSG